MTLVIPDRQIELQGADYGLKVLDPVDGSEIFNARYPILGSDVTNSTPQIISRRITVTNSSGDFDEPPTPTINWINDDQWKYTTYNQQNNKLIATIPHGQGRVPQYMVTGYAYVRRIMRMRYWHKDQDGSQTYNSAYTAQGGFRTNTLPPRLGGVNTLFPYPTAFESYQFNNVGPYTSPIYGSLSDAFLTITADDTNIYIRSTIKQNLNYQRLRETGFGWDRYEKYWTDLSGSWYQFTFYILPYDKNEDIFIR